MFDALVQWVGKKVVNSLCNNINVLGVVGKQTSKA